MAVICKIILCFTYLILFASSPIFCIHIDLSLIEGKEIATDISKSEKFLVEIISSDEVNDYQNSVNISYYSNENGTQTTFKTRHKNFTLLTLYLVIALFIVLVNVRVFYLVAAGKQRKSRSVNIFLAHLATLAIGSIFVSFFYALEKSNIFNLTLTAPGLCELFSFLRTGLLGAFPLNAVAIIYVRVTSSTSTTGEYVLPFRVICLIWLITIAGNLPSAFMVEYTKDPMTQQEYCKQIPLLGRLELTILYETFRFVIFHFLECAYMAYVMFQIRSKIRYLYIMKPIPNPRMERKVQRVRYIYLHSIVFIFIWLPTGVATAVYRVVCRQGPVPAYVKSYITPLLILCTSFFIWSPLIYLLLHEDTSQINFCGLSFCRKSGCINRENLKGNKTQEGNDIEDPQDSENNVNQQQKKGENRKAKNKRTELHEATDMSRISTVGESSTAAVRQKNPTEIDTPTVQLASTSGSSVIVTLVETEGSVCTTKAVLQMFGEETFV